MTATSGSEPVPALAAKGQAKGQDELVARAADGAVPLPPAYEGAHPDLCAELPEALPATTGALGWALPPPKWNREQAVMMVQEVASGRTLTAVCKEPWAVKQDAFRVWLIRVPKLREMYQAARKLQAAAFFDKAIDTAIDNYTTPRNEVVNGAARLLVQTLQWGAARLDPTQYADRSQGAQGVTIVFNTNLDISDADVAKGRPDDAVDMEVVEGVYTVKAPTAPVPADAPEPKPKRRYGKPRGQRGGSNDPRGRTAKAFKQLEEKDK